MLAHGLLTSVKALTVFYIVTIMLALGLELGGAPKESRDAKRRKRRALVGGLLFNLILLPLVTFGVVRALHVSNAVSVALLLLAASPGGRYAPHLVKLGGGDVALSVEITLFLAKISCFTAVPFAKWMLTLRALEIHELPFLLQLVLLQLLPFYSGKWLKRQWPDLAERLRRPTNAVAIAAVLAIVVLVAFQTDKWFEVFDARGWLAVACVGVALPLLGWLLAGHVERRRRTLAIGSGAREVGLALVMASFAFHRRPEVHAALLGVATLFGLVSFLLALAARRLARRTGSREPSPMTGVKGARAHA
jgi:bile acid:Na+ symporter, BASS family